MAKREAKVIISAENRLQRGLKSAGQALRKFGRSALKIGKVLAKGFLAAGAALVAFGVKAVRAYAVQERAEADMAAALRAHGDEIDANLSRVKAFASEIQNETGVADENLIARAARLRMLGVEADALEDATRATVALASAGMSEEAAIRAVARARGGDFQALTRYIPALRSATSESEKAQIVNDFLSRGYQQQKDRLGTLEGQWGLLKGRVGDAMEVFGQAISQNGALLDALHSAGDAVTDFAARISKWVEAGGLARLIQGFQLFYTQASQWFERLSLRFIQFAEKASMALDIIRRRANFSDMRALNQRHLSTMEGAHRDHARAVTRIRSGEAAAAAKAAREGADAQIGEMRRVTVAQAAEGKQQVAGQRRTASEIARIASMSVADLLNERKRAADQERQMERDAAKAARLERRAGVGVGGMGRTLSRKDQEFLDAFRQIESAREQMDGAGDAAGQALQYQGETAEHMREVAEHTEESAESLHEIAGALHRED